MIFLPDRYRDEWSMMGFEGPRHPCFLCGRPVGESWVIGWSGSIGSAGDVPENVRRAAPPGTPLTAAACIFLHPDCVTEFAKKLLHDYFHLNPPVPPAPTRSPSP